jgi:hypothetical protein
MNRETHTSAIERIKRGVFNRSSHPLTAAPPRPRSDTTGVTSHQKPCRNAAAIAPRPEPAAAPVPPRFTGSTHVIVPRIARPVLLMSDV